MLGRLLNRLRRTGGCADARQGLLFADSQPPLMSTPTPTHATIDASADAANDQSGRFVIDAAQPLATTPRPPRNLPSEPALPPTLFGAQSFAHPLAQRRTVLQGHAVAYAFTRARRRSIGMSVGPEGLSVRAPRWVTLAEVEAALQERAGWLVRHLHEQQARGAREQARRVVWADGAVVPYLGGSLRVLLDEGISGERLDPGAHDGAGASAVRCLRVGLRPDASADAIRDTVHAWLQRQARQHFEARVRHFAPLMGVQVKRLTLSAARTRWGSASADGSVRLNWRLVHHHPDCIDYVVVHELAHLRHMNHGPAFWRVVGAAMPGYEHAKARLHAEAHDVRD